MYENFSIVMLLRNFAWPYLYLVDEWPTARWAKQFRAPTPLARALYFLTTSATSMVKMTMMTRRLMLKPKPRTLKPFGAVGLLGCQLCPS